MVPRPPVRYGLRDGSAGSVRWRPGTAAVAIIAIAVLVLAVGAVWYVDWGSKFAWNERLADWMRREGIAGPLICIGVQILQVVIFAIPGEITQFAAGYVFGGTLGFAYSITGILIGSACNFGIAHAFGRPLVEKIVGADRLGRIDASLRSKRGSLAIFALFLMPGAPKDAMAYAAGLSALSIRRFLLLSIPARMPALLASTFMGSQLYNRNITALIWISAGVVIAIAGAAFYRWKSGEP